MDVSSLLTAARARSGLSQRQLAARAGTSQAMVARYERGRVAPSIETLERLLGCCGERLEVETRPAAVSPVGELGALVAGRRAELRRIARRHRARRLRLFGSSARGDDGAGSDVDLLVDMQPGATLLDLAAIQREAQEVLGVSVDVVTESMLRTGALETALRDAVLV